MTLLDKTASERNFVDANRVDANRVDAPVKEKTSTARIWLIRHGQTDWNHDGRYQGHSDIPLNQTGRAQAEAMALQLVEELQTRELAGTVQAIYSSDLQRAMATAQAAAAILQMPVIPDKRLREIAMGAWEGLYFDEITRENAELRAARYRDPMHVAPAGGETILDVARRLWQALDEYCLRHTGEGPILVASHGMAIASAICRAQGLSLNRVFENIPGNAEITMLDWHPLPPDWEVMQEEIAYT